MLLATATCSSVSLVVIHGQKCCQLHLVAVLALYLLENRSYVVFIGVQFHWGVN